MALDPLAIPRLVERKGSLYLRSDHMKYCSKTLNSGWDAARETNPKEYDISKSTDKDRNLLRATYKRIGNGNESIPITTAAEAMNEGQELKEVYKEKETNKPMIVYDNFSTSTATRETDAPAYGYGSILPRHNPDHDKRYLHTTNGLDYKYRLPWTPKQEDDADEGIDNKHRRILSEFTDTDNHRHFGRNIWQDYKTN